MIAQAFQSHSSTHCIGVTAPSTGFQAHAWLEGEQEDDEVFAQLLRWAPGVGVVDTNPRAGVRAGAAEN